MKHINYYSNWSVFFLIIFLFCSITAFSDARERTFEWNIRGIAGGVGDPDIDYNNIPHAGHDIPADHPWYIYTYDTLYNNGYFLGLMLQNDTAPINGSLDPDALATVMSYVERLNYVFADFEGYSYNDIKADVLEMVDQVRNSANLDCRNAYIGNYEWYPGDEDLSIIWSNQTSRTTESSDFLSSGLDCAMPACYPYASYIVHTTAEWPTEFRSPNMRSALFWAPLERFSTAKRALPVGYQIIPWVSSFIAQSGYSAPDPSQADCRALLQHLRLRGANGYYALSEAVISSNYTDRDEYNADMIDAWRDLSDTFAGNGVKSIINLDTNKTGGLEWSGIRNENKITVLVSNLSSSSNTADYPDKWDMPATSGSVTAGTHKFFYYTISNLLDNGDFNLGSDGWNLITGAATRESSGGVDNTGCLKLQGGNYSALGTQNIYVEPNAQMKISFDVKAESNAEFRVRYYYYDADGTSLGDAGAGVYLNPPTTYKHYELNFTIPDNSDIAYIRPILYNHNGDTDSNDIIWIDNLVIKFGSPNLLDNGDFNGGNDDWSFYSATWNSSEGVNDTGCLKLQGGYFSALGTQRIYVEPNTQMNVKYTVKGESSAVFKIYYYYYNAAGTQLGYTGTGVYMTTPSTFQSYERTFTIPDNSNIAYIRPILYNHNGITDPDDIIWVDNLSIEKNVSNLIENGNFNDGSDDWTLYSATWELTAGVDGTGCLKLQGGNFSVLGKPIYVEPNTEMKISFDVKAESNAEFRVRYYYHDALGRELGHTGAGVYINPPATYGHYEIDFTILNNPDIAYIRPILYNHNGDTDPNDIIWVDNLSISKDE